VATDVKSRLVELDRSLAELGSNDSAPAGIGDVFNALLTEAKAQEADDPVVKAIDPVTKSFEGSEFADITVGALRALVGQLIAAVDE
jgi:hypothetical protein